MTTRRKLFAGNWKMNKGLKETQTFLTEFVAAFEQGGADTDSEYLFFPQSGCLETFQRTWAVELGTQARDLGLDLSWGPQNMHWEASGAFTGEVCADLVKELGCTYVLAGHSERRQYFGESNEIAARRGLAAQKAGLRAVFCVGENLEERESGKMMSVIEAQCKSMFDQSPEAIEGLVWAYEPVWAIGTGKTATADQAEEAHAHIRSLIKAAWGSSAAEVARILYGGSVKPSNSGELLSCSHIDGVLVGGASLDPKSFFEIAVNAK